MITEYLHRAAASPPMDDRDLRATDHSTFPLRDEYVWTSLLLDVLPEIISRIQDRPLRVWSAGCSVGWEPLTLILLLSHPDLQNVELDLRCTDVHLASLREAQDCLTTNREQNLANIRKSKRMWVMDNSLSDSATGEYDRVNVSFDTESLLTPPNCEDYDLVFCRNVLRHYDSNEQITILRNLHSSLSKDGVLVLGINEGLRAMRQLNETGSCLMQKGPGIYARNN